jgi:hypothetical protein
MLVAYHLPETWRGFGVRSADFPVAQLARDAPVREVGPVEISCRFMALEPVRNSRARCRISYSNALHAATLNA